MQKLKFGTLMGGVVVALAGCGGGGSSDSSTDYTTKYVGTWKSGCSQVGNITDATTLAAAYTKEKIAPVRTSDTEMKLVLTIEVYASTDTSCTQASLGSIVWNGGGNGGSTVSGVAGFTSDGTVTAKVDGTATVDGKLVDKVTITWGALSTLTNANITVGSGNRFKFNTSDFAAGTYKDIYYVNGGTWIAGDTDGVASTAYPTQLGSGADYTFTKQ